MSNRHVHVLMFCNRLWNTVLFGFLDS